MQIQTLFEVEKDDEVMYSQALPTLLSRQIGSERDEQLQGKEGVNLAKTQPGIAIVMLSKSYCNVQSVFLRLACWSFSRFHLFSSGSLNFIQVSLEFRSLLKLRLVDSQCP